MVLEPEDNARLASVCGVCNQHLRQIEQRLGVRIASRGNQFSLQGTDAATAAAAAVLQRLYAQSSDRSLSADEVHLSLQESSMTAEPLTPEAEESSADGLSVRTRRGDIRPRGPSQQHYLRQIRQLDLVFGVGPAGTGKTYLAVAAAVDALESGRVRRLVLVRPAVEAGERLGFLPGDLVQKIDPYLRPLYDALYEMLGFDRVARLIERNIIEVAPLAFMRGRTLNEAFVIMDEAQNTTIEQMKMFLTRIGFGSQAVVTGDVTQIDLPRKDSSGLRHVSGVLRNVQGVGFTQFAAADVVRHPLVQRIVQAYDAHEAAVERRRLPKPGSST